jgi:muramoyltetrapeptide carboxypeptidase
MIRPNNLRKGDKVGIVATGRRVSPDDVTPAKTYFESLGLRVELAPHLFSDDHSYLAASDEHRLTDLQNFVDDVDIQAIFCARGGYGTTRIIDELVFANLIQQPKWIIGFSDITALHLKLFRLGIESIHGTMPIFFQQSDSSQSVDSLVRILFGEECTIKSDGSSFNRAGESIGQLIGGNLCLIVDSFGTSSEPDFAQKILVVEETDEPLYKVDRMFTQLRRAGALEKLNGLVVGHITNITGGTPKFGDCVEEIIFDNIRAFNYPVAFNFPTGHENPNLAWAHGSTMALSVSLKGSQLQPLSV